MEGKQDVDDDDDEPTKYAMSKTIKSIEPRVRAIIFRTDTTNKSITWSMFDAVEMDVMTVYVDTLLVLPMIRSMYYIVCA